MSTQARLSKTLKTISCTVLSVFGVLVFIFALLSGSDTNGGGISGIVKNSPNALPYLLLLVLIYFGWKRPLIGGALITLLGFGLLYLFGFFSATWNVIPFVVGIIPVIFGGLLIFSWGIAGGHKSIS